MRAGEARRRKRIRIRGLRIELEARRLKSKAIQVTGMHCAIITSLPKSPYDLIRLYFTLAHVLMFEPRVLRSI